MMTVIGLKILFALTICAPEFKTNIPRRYTLKSQRNEYRNYSISLLKLHLECIVKLVCEKKRRKNVKKKRELLL